MRLLTRKIHRAFPELDRHDDELCRAFVRVAVKRGRSLLLGPVILGLIVLASLGACIILFAMFMTSKMSMAMLGAGIVAMGVAGLVIALVARDVLLRRQIRRAIREVGFCGKCGYLLVGQYVDGSMVTCPECGTQIEATASESAEDGGSKRRVFVGLVPRESEGSRRRRRKIRWAAAGFVMLLVLAYAGWAGLIFLEAVQARRDRRGLKELRELSLSLQPIAGSMTDVKPGMSEGELASRNRWSEWSGLARDIQNIAAEVNRKAIAELDARSENDPIAQMIVPSHIGQVWLLIRGTTIEGRRPAHVTGPITEFEEAKFEYDLKEARALVKTLEDAGVFLRLDRLRGIDVAYRDPLTFDDGDASTPVVYLSRPDLQVAEYAGHLCVYRMDRALEAGGDAGREEYIAAFDTALALARMYEAQGTIIDERYAIDIESAAVRHVRETLGEFADVRWVSAVCDTMLARRRTVGASAAFMGQEIGATDYVRYVFSEPWTIQESHVLRLVPKVGFYSPPTSWRQRVGGLRENVSIVRTHGIGWARYAGAPIYSRFGPPMRPANPPQVASETLWWSIEHVRDRDVAEIDYAGTLTLLGVRHHELRTGQTPAALNVLSPEDIPALPPDPCSGKPFGYVLVDPRVDVQQRRYLVYSLGWNLVDDKGDRLNRWRTGQWNGGGDLIINEPVE